MNRPKSIAFLALLLCAAAAFAQERRVLDPLINDARVAAGDWRYTTAAPAEGWQQAAFDDQEWLVGYGGFGTSEVAGSVIGTAWTGTDIWIRKAFVAEPGRYEDLIMSLHHDDDVEVWINGIQAFTETGFVTGYAEFYLPTDATASLKAGLNTVAIHCRNAGSGPQYLDAGLFGSRTVNVTILTADARIQPQEWKYVLSDPGADWNQPAFPDEAWSAGPGGFGAGEAYAANVGTPWLDADIWLRRTFTAGKEFPEYLLSYLHDDNIEVYVNGSSVLQKSGWAAQYKELTLPADLVGVKAGANVIAVHCANAGTGPQFVDVGLLGMQGGVPTAPRPSGRMAAARKRASLSAVAGRLDISGLTRGRPGRLEILGLDGSLRASLGAVSGSAALSLPAGMGAGAFRYRWTPLRAMPAQALHDRALPDRAEGAAGRSEGRLVILP